MLLAVFLLLCACTQGYPAAPMPEVSVPPDGTLKDIGALLMPDACETKKRRGSIERRFSRLKARGAGGVSPLTIPACGRRTRATEPTQGE